MELHSVDDDIGGGMRVRGRVSDRAIAHDGQPIVFVHGLGMATDYLEPTMRLLAPDFAVSGLDLPGFGGSPLPERVLSLAGYADALDAWLRVRRIERPVLVGQSHGCQVVVELAARMPGRASALVLNAPTMLESHRSMARQLGLVALDTPREPLLLIPHVVRDYARAGPRRILRTLADALRDRIEDKLPMIGVPVSIVCGERDPVSPPAWGERLAGLAGGRFLVVPGAAHAVPFSHPEALAAEIASVARGQSGGSSHADKGSDPRV